MSAGDSVYGADKNIQNYLEEKDKKYMFAVSGKEYIWIRFKKYSVKKSGNSLTKIIGQESVPGTEQKEKNI